MMKINTLNFLGVFRKKSKHEGNFVTNGSRACQCCLYEGTSSLQRGVCTPGSALHFLVVQACGFWPTLMGAKEDDVCY